VQFSDRSTEINCLRVRVGVLDFVKTDSITDMDVVIKLSTALCEY
jgi:hypothetical protein